MSKKVSAGSEREILVAAAKADNGFRDWLDLVAPGVKSGEVHQVWLPELFMILKLLWEIYQFLQEQGCFKKMMVSRKVYKALRKPSPEDQELALKNLKGEYGCP